MRSARNNVRGHIHITLASVTVALIVVAAGIAAGARSTDAAGAPYDNEQQLMFSGGEGTAIHRNWLVVGDIGAESTGAAYVYRRRASGWVHKATLVPSDGLPGERFGGTMAISGKTIAVAAGFDQPEVVYLFKRTGSAWTEIAKLQPMSQTGWVVLMAMTAKTLAIGAPGDERVYVYARQDSEWTLQKTLSASADSFGIDVDLSGNRKLAVGSSEATYVYRGSGNDWKQKAVLPGRAFKLGIAGRSLVISRYNNEYAEVFEKTGRKWTLSAVLQGHDTVDGDGFAGDVAISGDQILVGALWHAGEKGAAYVFERDGAAWTEIAKLMASNYSYEFGNTVAISKGRSLVGSWGDGAWTFE